MFVHGEVVHVVKPFSPDMYARRETVVARLQELEENIDPIVRLFEDPEVAEHMKRCVKKFFLSSIAVF